MLVHPPFCSQSMRIFRISSTNHWELIFNNDGNTSYWLTAAMGFVNESYYALIKSHTSRLGIRPKKSIYVKVIRSFYMFMTLSFIGPLVVVVLWCANFEIVILIMPPLLTGIALAIAIWNSVLKSDKISVMIERMESHWKILNNTSAAAVLDKYAERVRYIAVHCSTSIYIMTVCYLAIPILPVILDFVDPLNETRPKYHLYEAEYGIDREKYYWLTLAHGSAISVMTINLFVAIETIFIFFVEHACALFEVVGFNLNLATSKYLVNKENGTIIHKDCNYRRICDCIDVHDEAIRFADMIESTYSAAFAVGISAITILISITSIQALMNVEHPEMLIRFVCFNIGQVFVLYCNTIPGQRIIDHSIKVQKFAYHLDWYDMPVKAQKLLIIILIRSSKPCFLTAGKIYIISMENFGSVLQTALSYFMVFAHLI